MELAEWEWTCTCCGRAKRGVPDLAFGGPIAWEIAGDDPDVRVFERTDDFCEVEICGDRFTYIRCVLPLPLAFAPGAFFGFGVWSTLSAVNAKRYRDSFWRSDQSRLGRMFGYLGNRLPDYPNTENLALDVVPRDGRQRPLVWLHEQHRDHPLWRDQREGIGASGLTSLLSRFLPCDGRA